MESLSNQIAFFSIGIVSPPMVFSRIFQQKPVILHSFDDAKKALSGHGFVVERMDERPMGKLVAQRIKVSKGDLSFLLLSDGQVLTFLKAIKLGDHWTDKSLIEWNMKKSYAVFTYSPEGNLAILKHHCLISEGIPEKTFLRLVDIWVGFLPRFLAEMGLSKSDFVEEGR